MLRWIIFILVAIVATSSGAATNCATPQSSVTTDNGFSFTFSAARTCGQYLDGTFWVLDPDTGSSSVGVTITATTPALTGNGASLRNGFDVNRIFARPDHHHLDGRICTQQGTACTDSLALALPTLNGGDSLIKAKSVNDTVECIYVDLHSQSCLKDATVLTVVKTVPTGLGCTLLMRPPPDGADSDYTGGRPTHFCFDSAQSRLNQNLGAVTNQIAPSLLPPTWFGTGSVWLDACFDSDSSPDRCHPTDNIPLTMTGDVPQTTGTLWYGAAVALGYATRIAWTTQGSIYSWAVREPHARIMAQIGIDLWGAAMKASDTKRFYAGGAIHIGRKAPVVYASYVLNAPIMLVGLPSPASLSTEAFFEDGIVYRDLVHAAHRVLWGRYVTGDSSVSKNNLNDSPRDERLSDGPGNRDGGNCRTFPAFGLTGGWVGQTGLGGPPTPPNCEVNPYPVQPDIDAQIATDQWSYSQYQEMTGSYFGIAGVMKAMGLDDEFNNDLWFEYVARINSPPWDGRCATRCSPFLLSYYRAYVQAGPQAPQPPVIY